jgi:hypothetical protein
MRAGEGVKNLNRCSTRRVARYLLNERAEVGIVVLDMRREEADHLEVPEQVTHAGYHIVKANHKRCEGFVLFHFCAVAREGLVEHLVAVE